MFLGIWAFQKVSELPYTSNTLHMEQHDLDQAKSAQTFSLSQFGLASIRVPLRFSGLGLGILSTNHCLNMQLFFTTLKVTGGLKFQDFYAKLSLNDIANDLQAHFSRTHFGAETDLTAQLSSFYSDLNLGSASEVFLNFFCPFWEAQSVPSNLVVRVDSQHDGLTDSELIRDSQTEFDKLVQNSGPSLVAMFEGYLGTASQSVPSTLEIISTSQVNGEALKVVPASKARSSPFETTPSWSL